MAKLPWMKWNARDWKTDPQLTRCSPATRGIWADFISDMHLLDQCGRITGTKDQLARAGRCTLVELDQSLFELSTSGAADVTVRDETITVTNRRMFREWKARKANADRQKRFRQSILPLNNGPGNAPVTPEKREERREKKTLPEPGQPEKPKRIDPHAEAFRSAFSEAFGENYVWKRGDFIQLAAHRKNYPDVTPERFVELARSHWGQGKYCPGTALSIQGLCANWSTLSAKAKNLKSTQAQQRRGKLVI